VADVDLDEPAVDAILGEVADIGVTQTMDDQGLRKAKSLTVGSEPECVRFFVRGDFLLSVSGCLSGVFSSRYLMPWCPVCVRP
jgi:hypothetical protein